MENAPKCSQIKFLNSTPKKSSESCSSVAHIATVIWLDDLLQINSVIIWISGTWLEKEKANFLSNLVYIKSRLLHLKSQQELNFIDLDSDGSGVEHNTTS